MNTTASAKPIFGFLLDLWLHCRAQKIPFRPVRVSFHEWTNAEPLSDEQMAQAAGAYVVDRAAKVRHE